MSEQAGNQDKQPFSSERAPLEIRPLTPEMQVLVSGAEFVVPSDIAGSVDDIWNTARQNSGGRLFDGTTICVTAIEGEKIYASKVPYRFFYAQRQSPQLRSLLDLKLLAVSGIVSHKGSVLFGKRSLTVTQYPGSWELVPSGAIDDQCLATGGTADYAGALLKELREETAIEPNAVESIVPFALILDAAEATWDICCRISLRGSPPTDVSNSEYSQLRFVPESALPRFLPGEGDTVVPTSLAILRYQGLI